MAGKSKDGNAAENALRQEMRDQEVLRATKELAAYFTGAAPSARPDRR
jgi:hypothetical protein